ncbi:MULTISPECIES: twin-arginine translocase subunit TatC [Idiomarina]|jgi:sec-independent protein translocase protein TatC|uniref:twin-arginine translocase subunit TatC n=2 Tax=Idiomarinaceae TaxID=267893 RepID=UPI0006C84FA4|nr:MULTISPECIES: twin-arginine translocase subunit TatC [Idiomarina]RDX34370.1 twin-arginine translocase subunit TatC [Idiomarina sp. HD9-110m-PIT-SAG05]KPD21133.1 twin-arginine protein translocation system subunit TatC [Idiomarina abyssalis]MAB22510.1 twin-arginine translocase subunit TatC [Idiomarina sp.]MAL84059.1 twin-arginine translocase subunit TatC [Idiomarina sp.]MBH93232.1 twin-arginine translocase subunit TatC [Idiomarina sp.]|tara:strand:+ start:3620 stop:4354 length:735 start_codon:yes stop_codon:yes gene_type:complete
MSDSPLLDHLLELRNRLLRSILVILLVFASLAYFANDIYHFVAQPLLSNMPLGTQMIATDVAAPFFTPFKLTLVVALALAVPYLLWQVWGFIAPGLYGREKRLVIPLLATSTLLFYAGIAFAYFVVLPVAMAFFTGAAPEGVTVATDISRYLDFVLAIFVAFGIAFETPVAIMLLIWTGTCSRESLAKKRPYIIVGAFAIGMLLTPPDVISQTLLAIPMWMLFELGLQVSRWYTPGKKEEDDVV